MQKIYKGDKYNKLRIFRGTNSSDGFISSMLRKLYDICIYSSLTMQNPRGFHLVLEDVNEERLKYLPRLLSRWAESRAKSPISTMNGQFHFIRANEIRSRTGEFHIHLHLVVDSVQYDDVVHLKKALMPISLRVKLKRRKDECRPIKYDPDTGEVLVNRLTGKPIREGSSWFHGLKEEFEDYFQRASYICKVKTKVNLDAWSGSMLVPTSNQDVVPS